MLDRLTCLLETCQKLTQFENSILICPKILGSEYDFLDLNPKNSKIFGSNPTRTWTRPINPNIISFISKFF